MRGTVVLVVLVCLTLGCGRAPTPTTAARPEEIPTPVDTDAEVYSPPDPPPSRTVASRFAAARLKANRHPLTNPSPRQAELPEVRAVEPEKDPAPRSTALTGEAAKRALLDLMGTRAEAPVCRADIEQFSAKEVKISDELGSASWGPFSLDLAEMRYHFTMVSLPGQRQWVGGYAGKFERQDGKWVACPPELKSCGIGR